MDADGTLTGAESYLFVTVSCKNSGDQTQEVLLNSNGFVTIDETGQLLRAAVKPDISVKNRMGMKIR